MDTMTRLGRYPLILSIVALLVRCSSGQTQAIGIFKLALDEPAGRKDQEYARPIVLRLRQTTRLPDMFHARLFRGSVADLKKRRPDSQGCVHFSTAIFPVTVTGTIQITALDDPAWLRPVGDGFQPEEYTIVFESGDEPSIEVIRIHQRELNSYFQYAFSMNLIPPENLKRKVVEIVRRAEEVLRTSTITYQQATKSVCWSVKAVQLAEEIQATPSETVRIAELSPCGEDTLVVPAAATSVMGAGR
jgi:hypothetical protein